MTAQLTSAGWHTWLSQTSAHCLLLDIDGTLAPFEINPSHSKIPQDTLHLLNRLQKLGVPIAVVTGRSLNEARDMLYPLALPIGATHGLEIAMTGDSEPVIADFVGVELPLIKQQIQQYCQQWQDRHALTGWLIEAKPFSVALHYRQNPDMAELVEATMQKIAQHFTQWQLKQGKFVWEIMPQGADKGQAVMSILTYFNQAQFNQACFNQAHEGKGYPIFIGDDISDEAGFLAVQAEGGVGIKVGEPVTFTHAQFFVKEITAVNQVLQAICQHYQSRCNQTNSPYFPSNEPIL